MKKKSEFEAPYIGIETIDNTPIFYNRRGDYSVIIKCENPIIQYSADMDAYYDFHHLFTNILKVLGTGYTIQKQDILCKKSFLPPQNRKNDYLSNRYFEHFKGRIYTDISTYLVITGEVERSKFFSFDPRRFDTFIRNITKVLGLFANRGIRAKLLNENEIEIYIKRFLSINFNQQTVSLKNIKAREEILRLHAKNKPFEKGIDFKLLAKNTAGFSGADLENMVNESILLAARKDKKTVTLEDIEEAMVKVMMGPEKKSKVISDKERKLTAYHEAGHAVVSKFLPNFETVHQISIIPRGMAGGYTMYKPNEDKNYSSKSEMNENIVSLLGGRVAESLILNDVSTGASNDIQRATQIARNMVTKYGMSDRIGAIMLGSGQEEVFLGRDFAQAKEYSEETAAVVDEEVKKIVDNAYRRAEQILKENIDKLHAVAGVLLEKEKIDGEEFDAIFNR